ncbi:hypothetical protein DPEC_G00064480 [Dallia pectoralis]|uniref:Uncharacterized protein n=1 Tax=Dallia pectoralis TaxID=75939 RepID=A0ACC2H7Z4_DALPE|nr:hypothetical protein DPEC_G00064480 [Dallia pectoralis]
MYNLGTLPGACETRFASEPQLSGLLHPLQEHQPTEKYFVDIWNGGLEPQGFIRKARGSGTSTTCRMQRTR